VFFEEFGTSFGLIWILFLIQSRRMIGRRSERKVLRLWERGGDRFRDCFPQGYRIKALGSFLVKPRRADEFPTEIRINETVVWIGFTTGSFEQGTLSPTRQFWKAAGFNLKTALANGSGASASAPQG
jgi:hypothetical protein